MKKLTKSSTDVQIAGVCGGLAEYFGLDSTLIRVAYLILTFMGAGSPILLYILLAFIMPNEKWLNNYL